MKRYKPLSLEALRHLDPNTLATDLGFNDLPVDIFGIIRSLGVGVYYIPDTQNFEAVWRQIQVRDSVSEIFISPKEPRFCQRFSAAHELGHLILHTHHLEGDGVLRRESKSDPYRFEEREADFFAAQVLMPRHRVGAHLEAGMSPRELASIYDVSSTAMSIRIREIIGIRRQMMDQNQFIR